MSGRQWKLLGFGEGRDTDGQPCWYLSRWRYGKSIEGKPVHVYETEWHQSKPDLDAALGKYIFLEHGK